LTRDSLVKNKAKIKKNKNYKLMNEKKLTLTQSFLKSKYV